jgi:hypothetical protein
MPRNVRRLDGSVKRVYYHVQRNRLYCDWHRNPAHRPPICNETHEINDDCPRVHRSDVP